MRQYINGLRSHLALAHAMLLAAAALPGLPTAQAGEVRFVPNVVEQFNALSERPDPLGFDIGDTPDPTTCKHYEAIVRLEAEDGTPYFALTRSGLETFPCVFDGNDPGNLIVVRMGSRDKNGERLRSNRLVKGHDLADTPSDPTCFERDCLLDKGVKYYTFDGNNGWPRYGHPEGMQMLGDLLVVGVDTPLPRGSSTQPAMQVLFINASDPENLTIVNSFAPNLPGINGGIVAITPLANGHYLLAISGGSTPASPFDIFNEHIWFFESDPTDGTPNGGTDLTKHPLNFTLKDVWTADAGIDFDLPIPVPRMSEDEIYAGQNWPTLKGMEHQTYNFLREGNLNGTLYLAGARGGIDLAGARLGDDILDLYRVDFVGSEIKLKMVSSIKKNSYANASSTFLDFTGEANFAAASGFYVSPSGELLFYATEHQNSGPYGTVRMGEWRHIDMVRPSSPTLLPGAQLFGPFQVPEGGDTVLSGLGQVPITKAWIELFSDSSYSGRYVVVDLADWTKDNFDNFKDLDGSLVDLHFGFSDEASSWRWFAPSGMHIRANDDDFGDSDFPGEHTRTLVGTGQPERDPALSQVRNDGDTGGMNDELTSFEFMDDCFNYYATKPDLFWDVDLNGSFSVKGLIANFSAKELDGPSQVQVAVKSVHPYDQLTGYTSATVQIVNVPPIITRMGVFNNLGQQLGVTVPFFLEKLPLTVRGAFTDPGKPDHQAAALRWGDGITDLSSIFQSFTDAFGGVVGQLAHTHKYATAGTYSILLMVTDDDDGVTSQTKDVPILTPGKAVEQIITLLNQLIANTTNSAQLKALNDARKALQGSVIDLSANGGTRKLTLTEVQAALTKLRQALVSLQAAQTKGADTGTLVALVQQVMASLQTP